MKNILRGLVWAVVGCGVVVCGVVGAGGGVLDGGGDVGRLVISAVNAGYTDGGRRQNYDFVEIYNTVGVPVDLAGVRIEYVNSVGNAAGVKSFGMGAVLNAEYLVLGFADSPSYVGVDENYLYDFGGEAGIASTAGAVRLFDGEVLLDEVCWGGVVCGQNFVKFGTAVGANMTIRRCVVDGVVEECGEWREFGFEKYYPEINARALYFEVADEPEVMPQCMGLVFSEIYSYFEMDYGEQFVEIYNPTDEVVELDGCGIGYKNKIYGLEGELAPEEYLAYRNEGLRLTKNPSSNNEILLVDVDGSVAARAVYYYGQKRGTAWAWFGVDENGEGVWKQTYDVTMGAENVYQEFRSCVAGKVINPRTGNCIGFFEDEELPACPVGKFRNPETNRCRSYESIDNILKPCEEGYYRNPETNRCRKATSAVAELKPCADGYERNAETNRCRKVRVNNGADFGVSGGTASVGSAWVGYGAFVAVVVLGLGYVGWQFRDEIKRGIMRVVKREAR